MKGVMRIRASDIYSYFCPSPCALRICLAEKGVSRRKADPYDEMLFRLGEQHEKKHLEDFASYVDLSQGTERERIDRTREQIEKKANVLYQPLMSAKQTIQGVDCDIVGAPDYLIFDGNSYQIRDAKMARRIDEKNHPEIFRQLELYAWLFENTFHYSPSKLQVYSGSGEVQDINHDDYTGVMSLLETLVDLRKCKSAPYEPVGWSKCSRCGFFDYCWPTAEEAWDVATVRDVDQGLAAALHARGITSIQLLVDSFDEGTLSSFKRQQGSRSVKVGVKAKSILASARAKLTNSEMVVEKPDLGNFKHYVMFDLEGLPPHFEEQEKIYLWGIQVFGDHGGKFCPAFAGFDESGDEDGWKAFLENAAKIFSQYGDCRFVHWGVYERTMLGKYIERYGDPDDVAQRVMCNLMDLCSITKRSIILPIPSYSLKIIEKYVGFKRTQEEYGGNWAMAKYIEAIETHDDVLRKNVMEDIALYNKEDLQATWEVFQWLRSKA